ncbi:MAG TPA: ABC transporter permease [Candidatus Dormibacteraeota bacterium]|nr:ABC transporter permease [Candidatus Dormibacteraeota bacterium]
MSQIAVALWNPIVAKEYRSRMRTWRSPIAMTVYIVLIGGLGWAVFALMSASATNSFNPGQAANYGQTLFMWLILFQMALLSFITPALTAGAISSERERQTMDLLFVTKLPPFSILWGKLLASMSFVLLLLLLSVPIFSLVFLFGGIELDQMVAAFIVTCAAALTFGFIGIAFSTLFQRTLPATVATYGAAFALIAGSLLYGLLFPTPFDSTSTRAAAPPAVTYLSPVLPLITIGTNGPINSYGVRYGNGPNMMASGGGIACSSGPTGVQTCYPIGPGKGTAQPLMRSTAFPQMATGTAIPSGLFAGWQYWQASVALWALICLGALLFAAFMLPPVRRFPWRKSPSPAGGGQGGGPS